MSDKFRRLFRTLNMDISSLITRKLLCTHVCSEDVQSLQLPLYIYHKEMAGQIVSCPCMMSKIILSLEMQTYYWSFVLIRKTLVDEKPKPQRYAKEEESWRSEDGRAQAPKIQGTHSQES